MQKQKRKLEKGTGRKPEKRGIEFFDRKFEKNKNRLGIEMKSVQCPGKYIQ